MVQFPCFLRSSCASLALSPRCVCFSLIPTCYRSKMPKMLSIFTSRFSNPYLEFFHQGLKRHLFTSGGLFISKKMDLDLYIGIIIVHKCQKIILISTYLDIQTLVICLTIGLTSSIKVINDSF